MFRQMIGTPVLIRDNAAGVFFGVLEDAEGKTWRLGPGARQIHYWTKAAACMGVAVFGPGPGSRVTPPVSGPVLGLDLVQMIGLTEDEYRVLAEYPVWNP